MHNALHLHKPDASCITLWFHSTRLTGFSQTDDYDLVPSLSACSLPLGGLLSREQMQIGMSVRVMNMQVTDGKKGSEKTLSPIPPPRSSLWRLNGHLKSRSDVVIGQNLR